MRSRLTALAFALAAGAGLPALAGPPDPALQRGQAIAHDTCARCHGVATGEDSRNAGAPRFVVIAGRYNEISLEDRLSEIAKQGHYEMPPQPISREDIRSLTAYIESLAQP